MFCQTCKHKGTNECLKCDNYEKWDCIFSFALIGTGVAGVTGFVIYLFVKTLEWI